MYYEFIIHELNCSLNFSYEDRKNVIGRGDFTKGETFQSQEVGGLWVRRIKDFNLALLGK